MRKVRCAIKRINAPTQAVLFTCGATLFSQDGDVWRCSCQNIQNNFFCGEIGVGDKVSDATFAFNGGQASVVAHQLSSTLFSGLASDANESREFGCG